MYKLNYRALLLPVPEIKLLSYWNSTSGFDRDLHSSVACDFTSIYPRRSYDVISIFQDGPRRRQSTSDFSEVLFDKVEIYSLTKFQ